MSSARGARLKAGDPRGGFPFSGMNGRRRCRCPMSIRHADAGFTAKKARCEAGFFATGAARSTLLELCERGGHRARRFR
ncbi:hypothetical protein, partial [Burkholderia pseudomallei]